MSLAAYRHLLRAARIAFQGNLPFILPRQASHLLTKAHLGDAPILSAAQVQIRNEFRQKSNLSDSDSVQAAVDHAEQVARVLRENVVQGQRQEGNDQNYSMLLRLYTDGFATQD